MICAIFGTSSSSQFSKDSGIFANAQQNVEAAASEDNINIASYGKENAEMILQAHHQSTASNIDTDTWQN